MMSTTALSANPRRPGLCVTPPRPSSRLSRPLPRISTPTNSVFRVPRPNASSFKSVPVDCSVKFAPLSNHQMRRTTVCLMGGKDKSEDEASPWKSFEKAMGSFKGQSVEDVLRQQIEKQEFYDGGGSGKNPPRGGGGGGGSEGGSGEAEDEGFAGMMDEFFQVVFATIGFVFLYVYIINGEELTRLAKDYIKYLLGRGKSVRLKRAMKKWERFYKKYAEREEEDKMWLEKAIISTPTWFDSPEKYKYLLKQFLDSNSDE